MSQPAGLASLNPSTGTVLYGRGQLGSIRLKTSQLSAISILAVLILWELLTVAYSMGTNHRIKGGIHWSCLILFIVSLSVFSGTACKWAMHEL